MEYKIVERKPFKLLAKVEAFRNESVSEKGNKIYRISGINAVQREYSIY